MNFVLGIALYFVIWWMVLFAVLPLGVRSQYEAGEIVPGSEGAAPHQPMMLRKVLITTVLAALVFGLVCLLWYGNIVSLDSLPGPTLKGY